MKIAIATFSALDLSISCLARRNEEIKILLHDDVHNKLKRALESELLEGFDSLIKKLVDGDYIILSDAALPRKLSAEQSVIEKIDEIICQRSEANRRCGSTYSGSTEKRKAISEIEFVLRVAEVANIKPLALVSHENKIFFEAADIPSITVSEFEHKSTEVNPYFAEAKKIDKKHFFRSGCLPAFMCFGLPLVLAAIFKFLYWLFSPQISYIKENAIAFNNVIFIANENAWRLSIIIWIVGVILYWVRSRYRLTYGFLECTFGVFASYLSVPSSNNLHNYLNWLTFLGAMYIIVRGLDNIGKALKQPSLIAVWKWLFGENY